MNYLLLSINNLGSLTTNPPLISIIIPVYKSEQFLAQCLDSLINQTLRHIEIILINDGSPDNSGAICDNYASQDNRFKVQHQANMGAANACNNGVLLATAEYLMFLDADDWIDTDTCKIAYETATLQEADVVFWSYYNEYPNKSVKSVPLFTGDRIFEGETLYWLRRRMIGLIDEELKNPLGTDSINMVWAKIYRRELYLENKILMIDTNIIGSTDVLVNIYLFQYVTKVVYINQFYNHYRRYNPNALTGTYKFTLSQKLLNLFSFIESIISNNSLSIEYKQALNNRIALSVINNVLTITSVKNTATTKYRVEQLRSILNHPVYSAAIQKFELSYLPIHWRLFYILCKTKSAMGVYFLGLAMHKTRRIYSL